MPLPDGVETVTVSSGQPLVLPDGTPQQGRLLFTAPDLAVISAQDVTLGGTVEVQLVDGEFSVDLVATDAAGISPTGWTYKVRARLTNGPDWVRYLTLPKATASVVLADVLVPDEVAGEFTVLVDPSSIGGSTPASTVVDETAFGQSSAVGTALEYARADHTHGTPATPSVPAAASTVTAETSYGASSSAGAAATYSRGDHTHGTPALPTAAAVGALPTTGGTVTSTVTSSLATGTTVAEASIVSTGDTFDRWRRDASGRQDWGSGTAARDTNLYRAGADRLATDDSLSVGAQLVAAGRALGTPQPADHGLKAWACAPEACGNSALATAGTLFLSALYVAETFTPTTLYWHVSVVAVTPTAGQNYVGIYDSSGNLLGSAVGIDSDTTSTGTKATTISVGSLTAGAMYWVGWVFNAGTAPQMPRPGGSGITGIGTLLNVGLSTAASRFATNGTGRTTMPSSITPASNTAASGYWAAIK